MAKSWLWLALALLTGVGVTFVAVHYLRPIQFTVETANRIHVLQSAGAPRRTVFSALRRIERS
jgi:hypothetical protein